MVKFSLLYSLILCVTISACQSEDRLERQSVGMVSNTAAQKWQDGLISGNGTMGILVFGDPSNERIIFNHEECYEFLGTEDIEPPYLAPYMPEIKQLLLDGNYKAAAEYSIDKSAEKWKRLWTDPYHPAMVMDISQELEGMPKDYQRSVDFETGEIEVNWTDDNGRFLRKSFVSRSNDVVVQQLRGEVPFDCRIKIADLLTSKVASKKYIKGEFRLKTPILNVESDWITYRVGYTAYSRGYEASTKIIVKGGTKAVADNEIIIGEADEVLLLTRITFLEDFNHSKLNVTRNELDSLDDNYDVLLHDHSAIHKEIFNRVKFEIYNGDKTPSEELISKQLSSDTIDSEYLEILFNMGRYSLISSSGKLPPNLSGIWQGDFRPHWSGDFTLDANVNMQISGANLGNLPEAIDAYMNLLERISPDWEVNAQHFYGIDGYLSGIRTSGRRNLSTHYSVYGPWQFWTSGAQWLLLPAYEYYQTSGDQKFLKQRLLPMMKKTVQFYEGFLTTFDTNGNYIFVPSASPENTPANSTGSTASVNSTIDIAAAKEAITNLISVCEELDIEQNKIPEWKAMLEKFPPYLLNAEGGIKEWASLNIEDRQAHRHISHLYPVWPGHEINQKETPELFQAAIKAIELREIGDGSAFGMAHRALICSRLKMHDDVYNAMLSLLNNNYFYTSLFSAHNPVTRIYNADLINGFPAIIMESLVYSSPGFIEMLPAWSPKLPKGKISGITCRSNATVSSLAWDFNQHTVQVSITSDKVQEIELYCKWGISQVKSDVDYSQLSPHAILFHINKGQMINFTLKTLD